MIDRMSGIMLSLAACLVAVASDRADAATTPQLTSIPCKSAKACVTVSNTGTGPGAVVSSLNDTGLSGSTAALNAPFITVNGLTLALTGGVSGNDVSGSPLLGGGNNGVVGTSVYGSGIFGATYNTFNYGAGTDVNTFGAIPAVFGLDVGPNTGIDGSGNVGIAGRSLTRVGGLFLSKSGYGAVGRSFTGTGVLGVGRAAGAIALAATSLAGGPIFIGNNGTQQVAALDSSGDLTIAGNLRTGDTAQFTTRSASGTSLITYAARQSIATVEDFGQIQMRGGYAAVALDPQFAKIMDPATPYLVFVTAEGENHGIYVTGKSAAGFIVRESGGGRSTLALSYRIVAHSFGLHEARLATAPAAIRVNAAKRASATTARNVISE